ncbi:uncharacterized protein LOC128263160 [Drosophila gunungcola]|nr:uncharacterized protein LOC128263160 [Drosophila gunungcola]
MRFCFIFISLTLLSLVSGFPSELENNCELLEHVDTDDSWLNIFNNIRKSLEDAISRASYSEKCASQVEFLQSCLDRAKTISSTKEQMQYVLEFIEYQEMHAKREPTRTHTYLGKNMIHLFKRTLDKLTHLSRKLINVSEKLDDRFSKTIFRSRQYLFGHET